ncbi:MAG: erythromycin esterase family protein [Lachnospiraceae bacterium]|nr:erythromycin esterase family protein [Lachnospiraceae bacterium]
MKRRFVTVLGSMVLAVSLLTGCGAGKGTSGEMTKIEGFDEVVTGIENIEIPEGVRIVALGEATHGNSEFQQLKREVFEILNEKHGIKALILEGDFGGCSLVNDYIQGGEGDTRSLPITLDTDFIVLPIWKTLLST